MVSERVTSIKPNNLKVDPVSFLQTERSKQCPDFKLNSHSCGEGIYEVLIDENGF